LCSYTDNDINHKIDFLNWQAKTALVQPVIRRTTLDLCVCAVSRARLGVVLEDEVVRAGAGEVDTTLGYQAQMAAAAVVPAAWVLT